MDAIERAIKTGAQVLLGVITGLAAFSDVDWAAVGLSTAVAVAGSLLTSIISAQVGSPNNASLVLEDNPPQPVPEEPDAAKGVG